MRDVYVRIPVSCPVCARETWLPLSARAIVDSVDNAAPLRLSAACHALAWLASAEETEQIREYLLSMYRSAANDADCRVRV